MAVLAAGRHALLVVDLTSKALSQNIHGSIRSRVRVRAQQPFEQLDQL